ncbi:MAG: helix-turn-helix domain-containing protein [Spirochaetia bacterium]
MCLWRRRYLEQEIQGLHDELRAVRPRSISDEMVATLVRKTLQTKPKNGTHWTIRTIAKGTQQDGSQIPNCDAKKVQTAPINSSSPNAMRNGFAKPKRTKASNRQHSWLSLTSFGGLQEGGTPTSHDKRFIDAAAMKCAPWRHGRVAPGAARSLQELWQA